MLIKAKVLSCFLLCIVIMAVTSIETLKPALAAEQNTYAAVAPDLSGRGAGDTGPVDEVSLYIPHRFHTFENLDRVNTTKDPTFGPQTVTVLDRSGDDMFLISTYLGPRWICLRDGYEKIVNPYVPYSYEQQIRDAIKLAGMYPELISVFEIGRSVEDRQIITIQLGKGKKSLIMVGSHHAREYITSAYLMKMIDEYAYAYHTTGRFGSYDIKKLLDSVTIHVVVMLNPDGVNLVQNGPDSVRDRAALDKINMLKSTYDEWKSNINGVNLNANYPAEWNLKMSTGAPDSETFKGYKAGSEPEVRALMAYTKKNNFKLAVSFHSKGEVVYWADKRTQYDFGGQRKIADAIVKSTGYLLLPVSLRPSIYAAGYENWFRAEFRRPAFCIELTPLSGNNNPHNDSDFDSLVWNKARYLGAVLAAECLKL